jgi:hypothetical protein
VGTAERGQSYPGDLRDERGGQAARRAGECQLTAGQLTMVAGGGLIDTVHGENAS